MTPPLPRSTSTPLQRHLDGASATRPTAIDAFRAARSDFLAGDRIDMQSLARELNVDRATLYRWVGSRERLLTAILWSLIEPTIATLRSTHSDLAERADPHRSPAAAIFNGLVRAVNTNTGMQHFIDREGELALRLLTTKASDFEARLIRVVSEVLEQESAAGRLHSPIPSDDLPYVLVRVMESYTYLGLITGDRPDMDRCARVVDALLPERLEVTPPDSRKGGTP